MKKNAFTLIELLVVISIIALLASVVLASVNVARDKGRIGAARHLAAQIDHIAGDSAVGIWNFDECSGLTAFDRSGFGNNGTLTNMATTSWSSDTFNGTGCSLDFDGTNDFVDMGSPASLDMTGSYTVSAWINKEVDSGYLGIVGRHDNNGYNLALDGTGTRLRLDMMTSTSSYGSFTSGKVIADNIWHHVAAVYDQTAQKVYFYYDGALTDTLGATASYVLNPSTTFIVGYEGYGGRYWNGKIDNVRLFSKALAASEVGTLYAYEASQANLAKR